MIEPAKRKASLTAHIMLPDLINRNSSNTPRSRRTPWFLTLNFCYPERVCHTLQKCKAEATSEQPTGKPNRNCSPRKIDVTRKLPVGSISVVTLSRTDTTLDHSQKAEKVCTTCVATSYAHHLENDVSLGRAIVVVGHSPMVIATPPFWGESLLS